MSDVQVRVNHDDQPDEIVEKVNKAMAVFGLGVVFKDDGEEYDGWCVYNLVPVDKK